MNVACSCSCSQLMYIFLRGKILLILLQRKYSLELSPFSQAYQLPFNSVVDRNT